MPCPSIFDRRRPLAEATQRRIAAGLKRYVLDAARPFIVPITHTTSGDRVHSIDTPLRTITTAKGGELALVTPSLTPYVMTNTTGHPGRSVEAPLATVTTGDHHYLVSPVLASHYGESVGRSVLDPVPTVTAGGGGHTALVAAFLAKHYGGVVGHDLRRPVGTVTGKDHHALTTATLAPVGDRCEQVHAFLVKYYGTGGQQQSLFDPLHTVTSKARFGLVTVAGEPYAIVDIGMRMLTPRELFRAQGFPDSYVIDLKVGGRRITKTQQIALAGNSVPPDLARALVEANVGTAERRAA